MTESGRVEKTIENPCQIRFWLNYIEGCRYETWSPEDLARLTELSSSAEPAERKRAVALLQCWTAWDVHRNPWCMYVYGLVIIAIPLIWYFYS